MDTQDLLQLLRDKEVGEEIFSLVRTRVLAADDLRADIKKIKPDEPFLEAVHEAITIYDERLTK